MARRTAEGERRRTRPSPGNAEVALVSDRELLGRFANHRDEAAFDALFHRHGAMVLATSRRVLGNSHDAEDVCQASFLLLAKKAATNRWQPSIAPWLHRTAHLLALKARTAAARRSHREGRAAAQSAANPLAEMSGLDLLAILDAEVLALPEPLRGPIVLCYLEGATRDEAAERLRCPLSTLKHRLERGRERLHAALVRRGMGLSTVLLGTLLTRSSVASASDGLAKDTVRAAAAIAANRPMAISAPVRELVEGGVGTMLRTKVQALLAVLLVVGLISFAGTIAGRAGDDNPAPNPLKEVKAKPAVDPDALPSKSPRPAEAAKDAFGDPLPPGAVARLGTVRFRTSDFPKHVVASPDGKQLVTTAFFQQSRLAIWDANDGRPLREVEVPRVAYPEAVCWPPDGRGRAVLKVGMKDYVVWEFTNPEAKPPVGDGSHSYGVGSFSVCAFAPDGTLIAGGERAGDQRTAGKLQVWPVHPGRPVREANPQFTIDKPDGFVALSFTPDGKQLVGITQGRQPDRTIPPVKGGLPLQIEPGAMADIARVFVWDIATWKEVAAFDIKAGGFAIDFGRSQSVRMAVSPDGKTLYTPTLDAHVKAFDLATGKERFDVPAFGPPGEATKALGLNKSQIGELAVTPDGKTIIVAELMGRTVGLDAATGKERWRGGREFDSIYGIAVFSDGKRFALGHGARQIGVYDAATGKPMVEPAGPRGGLTQVGITPDGQSALTVGWDNILRRWNLTTGRLTDQTEAQSAMRVRMVGFSPDGKRIAGREGLIDTATGKLVSPFAADREEPRYQYGPTLAAWLPDASVVVSDGNNSAVRFSADGKKLAEYIAARPGKSESNVPVASVAVAPNGKTVVLAGEEAPTHGGMMRSDRGWVAVFDAAKGTKLQEWKSDGTGGFTGAAFLPDGSRVVLSRRVSASSRSVNQPLPALDLATAVVLFNPATGDHSVPFDAPDPVARDRWVRSVAVSPAGTQVAAVEWDNSLTVYETASGAIRRRFRGHRGPVEQLAFTPDERRLVSVSYDGTGLVWDAAPPRPDAPAGLSKVDRERCWATLLTSDAPAAHRTMGELAADPAGTVTFMKSHLKPTVAPSDADLDRLIAGLGAAGFTDRETAARDIDLLGGLIISRVRAKLPDVKSSEVRQRLDDFVKRHDRPGRTTGHRLREVRAVELLEMIGTSDARALLTELARGDTTLASEAAAATRRMRGR